MSTFPVTSPGTYEVVIKGTAQGAVDAKPVVNLLHYYSRVDPLTPSLIPSFITALATAISAVWGAVFPNVYTVNSVGVRWMEDSGTPTIFDPTPAAYNGTRGIGDMQPPDSSWFTQKISQGRGRSYRGGLHMSPLLEGDTTDFRLTAGFLSGPVAALLTALMLPISFGPAGVFRAYPFLVSTKLSSLVVSGPCVIRGAEIIQVRARKTLGTMDRRKLKGVY